MTKGALRVAAVTSLIYKQLVITLNPFSLVLTRKKVMSSLNTELHLPSGQTVVS